MNSTTATRAGQTLWAFPPLQPLLGSGEVHVWRASLAVAPAILSGLLATLSDQEKARASGFRFERDRDHFVAAHAILRRLAGRYLDRRPSDLQITAEPMRKPTLTGDDAESAIRFSLSHAGGLALFAFSHAGEVGIDLEKAVPLDLDELTGFFCEREIAELRCLVGPARQAALLRGWTRKEAYIKAIGQGMSASLQDIQVTLAPGATVLLRSPQGDEDVGRWAMKDLDVAPGFAACVVWEREAALTCWACPWPAALGPRLHHPAERIQTA